MSGENPEDGSLGDEASALLADPIGYIRGIVLSVVVGSFISVLMFAISTGVNLAESLRSSLSKAGGAVTDSMLSVWGVGETVLALPIELAGDLSASAGVLGPVVSGGAFALTAAIAGALVYALWRAVVIIT